jgi:hypothetical protein
MMTEFTDEEKDLHDTYFASEGFVLVRAVLDGRDVAVVSHMLPVDGDDSMIRPVAILVTDAIIERLDAGSGVDRVVWTPDPEGGGE